VSLIVSGPRRVYVIMLLWERVAGACAGRLHALSRIAGAIGAEPAVAGDRRSESVCHLILSVRLCRVLWKRLIGLRVLVLDPQP
jgi:hypothetical protein